MRRTRQQLGRDFGATDIVAERGDDGVARIKEMTHGLGVHSTIGDYSFAVIGTSTQYCCRRRRNSRTDWFVAHTGSGVGAASCLFRVRPTARLEARSASCMADGT